MPPVNPLIALQSRAPVVDQSGFNDIARLMLDKKDRERQAGLDEENAKDRAQERKVRSAQLEHSGEQRRRASEEESLKNAARDALRYQSLFDAGDFDGVERELLATQTRVRQAGLSTVDTDAQLELYRRDRNSFRADVGADLDVAERFNLLNPAPESFSEVRGPQGNILGQRSSLTGKVVADPRKASTPVPGRDVPFPDAVAAQKVGFRRAGKPTVDVSTTIDNKGLSAEQKALAQNRAGRFDKIVQSALTAEEQNAGLAQLRNIDVETGFGEGTKAGLARVLNAFGADGDSLLDVNVANVQALNKLTGKLVLDVMSTQKGPQTDADQARIAKTLPNIGDERLAKEFNLNSIEALNDRKIEMAQFYEDYLEENETLKGVRKAWSKFKQSTPLLSDNIKNPETGLPMFFGEFKRKLIENNPGTTEEQAREVWRKLANG